MTLPDLEAVKARLRRYYQLQVTDNLQSRTLNAQNNQPDYGRDIAKEIIDGLLLLCLDYTNEEKRDIYVYLVQMGIDIWGRVVAEGVFPGIGADRVELLHRLLSSTPPTIERSPVAKSSISRWL